MFFIICSHSFSGVVSSLSDAHSLRIDVQLWSARLSGCPIATDARGRIVYEYLIHIFKRSVCSLWIK